MSPVAELLRDLRLRRGLRQHELAAGIGCGQRYISALEVGHKGPPGAPFIERLITFLELDEQEQAELHKAVARSRTRYELPPNAPKEVYEFVAEFFDCWDQLHPAHLRLARDAFALRKAVARPVRRPLPGANLQTPHSREQGDGDVVA